MSRNALPSDPASTLRRLWRSLAVATATGDRAGEAAILNGLGKVLRALGRAADAAASHRAALAVATAGGLRSEEVSAHLGLGYALHDAGDAQGARRHWVAALHLRRNPAAILAPQDLLPLRET